LEADWEVEVGGDAPVIDALWPGFIDLRWTAPSSGDFAARARSLPEGIQLPALAVALERLNSPHSPVWTSKCDFWPALQPEDFDPDELDAPTGCSAHAVGGYIDLLPKSDQKWSDQKWSDQQWSFPGGVEERCKELCARLRAAPQRCCRVDLIVRHALIAPDVLDMGITAYFTACGATPAEATRTLEGGLSAFVDVLCPDSTLQ